MISRHLVSEIPTENSKIAVRMFRETIKLFYEFFCNSNIIKVVGAAHQRLWRDISYAFPLFPTSQNWKSRLATELIRSCVFGIIHSREPEVQVIGPALSVLCVWSFQISALPH